MSRGKKSLERKVIQDPKYQSSLVGKFINYIMMSGKKSTAQDIVYGALDIVGEKKSEDGLKIFEKAIEIIRPQVEVRSRRVGGSNYQVPMPVMGARGQALAFRWVIAAARARKGKTMKENLASELLDILEGVGGAMKKKEDTHRMAEANKAFAHFARRR